MKALHVALALVLVLVGGLVTVWANPGDAVAVRGTLAWPAILANEPFVVVRSDDGRFFYVDVTAARRGNVALRTGDRITVAGVEGPRPYELAATALGPGDTAVSAAQPPGRKGGPPGKGPRVGPGGGPGALLQRAVDDLKLSEGKKSSATGSSQSVSKALKLPAVRTRSMGPEPTTS